MPNALAYPVIIGYIFNTSKKLVVWNIVVFLSSVIINAVGLIIDRIGASL